MASHVLCIVKFLFAILTFIGFYFNCSFAQTFSEVSVLVKNHLASSETTTIKVYKTSNQEVKIHKASLVAGSLEDQYLNFEGTDRTDAIISSNDDLSATLNLTGLVKTKVGIYTVNVSRVRQDQQEDVESLRILILNNNASVTPMEYSTVVLKGDSVTLFAKEKPGGTVNSLRWRKNGVFQGDPCFKTRSCTQENAQESTVFECFVAGEYGDGKHTFMNLIVRECPEGQWEPTDCAQRCPRCFNGGICSDKTGLCQCPPGFSGTNCEQVHGRNVFGQSGEHKCDETGDDHSEGCEGALICYPNPFGCVCPAGYTGLDCTEECKEGKFGANCKQTCHCQENVACAKDTGVCGDNQCSTGWKGVNCQVEDPCEVGVYGDLCIKNCSCSDGNCREVEVNCVRGCAEQWIGLACDQNEPGRINITYVKVNPNVETSVTCSAISNPVTRKANLRLTFGGAIISPTEAVSSLHNRSYSQNNTWMVTLRSNSIASTAVCSIANSEIRSELILSPYVLPSYRGGNPLTVSTVTSTSIHVTWRAWSEGTDNGNGPVVDYLIRYRALGEPYSALSSTGTTLGADFADLTPDTQYDIQMRVVREGVGGEGPFNGVISQRTTCGVPSVKPQISLRSQPSPRSAEFSIQIPDSDTWNCNTLTVELQRQTPDGGWEREEELQGFSTSTSVNNLIPCSSYSFRVRISTGMGSLDSDPEIFEKAPEALGMVRNLQVTEMNRQGRLGVSWDAPDVSQSNCPIDSYTVRYRLVRHSACSTNGGSEMDKFATTSQLSYVLRNLEAYATYRVGVYANGRINSSEVTSTARTAETVPSAAPTNVRQTSARSTSLQFSWGRLPCRNRNGVITNYYYRLTQTNGNSSKEDYRVPTSVTISDLTPYTEYSFIVSALTSIGSGPFSNLVIRRTAEDRPPKLLPPVSYFANTSVIEVAWKVPNPPHGVITEYDISYGRDNKEDGPIRITATLAGEPPSYILLGLDTSANYSVKVRAYTSIGPGPYSESLVQITEEGLPDHPTNLNVSRRTLTKLVIEWDSPKIPRGTITKYEVQYQAIEKPYEMGFWGENPTTVNINDPKESNSHTITNLAPSTIYEIQVSAYTIAGQGKLASINGTTALYTNLKAVNVNEVSTNREVTTAEIILPALTQQYATGYRIRIRSLPTKRTRTVSTIRGYEDNPDDYITAELGKKEEDGLFTIGDGKIYGKYYNAPLQKDKEYEMFISTISKVGEEIQEVSSSPIPLMARNRNVPYIVIVILIIIAIVTIVAGIVWYKRKNKRRSKTVTSGTDEAQRHSDYEVPMDLRKHVETDDDYERTIKTNETSNYNVLLTRNLTDENACYEEPIQLKKDSEVYDDVAENSKQTFIAVSDFHNLMTKDKKDLAKMSLKEFTMLPKGEQLLHTKPYESVDVSIAKEYDHSRVKLSSTETFVDCRYFNANYIKNSKGNFRFIAAQGPQGKFQVVDFWRMIWQTNVKTVVMLGETSAENTDICSRYWPENVNMSDIFDDITVLWMESLTYDTYTVRKMTIIKQGDNIHHTVHQVHFHQWVYRSVPEETTDLISITQKVKVLGEGDSDPILVHCSDGNGATGTFIAIYCLMDVLKVSSTISVYDFVKNMRKDRPGMVQTKIQYQFIFEALQEAQLIPEGSRISTGQLKVLEDRSLNDKAENEYEVLQKMKRTLEAQDDNAGRTEVNIHKNRFKDIIPCDKFRPTLKSEGLLRDSNDYINATLFENCGRRFVMTQAPMKNTLEDFWRLVYDYGCNTIIMLDDANPADKTFVQYWPDAGKITFGAMKITCQDETHDEAAYDNPYNMRQYTLFHQKQKNSISVKQFAFNARSGGKNQPDGNKLAEFVAFSRNKLSSKTLVHCRNGVGLCAVYVIAMSQIESLSMDGACDVFLSAYRLRKQNQHILQNQEEYALCFQLLRNYYTNEADYMQVY